MPRASIHTHPLGAALAGATAVSTLASTNRQPPPIARMSPRQLFGSGRCGGSSWSSRLVPSLRPPLPDAEQLQRATPTSWPLSSRFHGLNRTDTAIPIVRCEAEGAGRPLRAG
eukprot:365542-Chlamydomonas_euryale.AAC.46